MNEQLPSPTTPRMSGGTSMYSSPPTMRKFESPSSPPVSRNRSDSGQSNLDEKKRSRGRPPLPKGLKCEKCNTTDTPEWRVGENGPHTLCNACGLQFAKKKKMEQESRARHSIRNLLNGEDGTPIEQIMQEYVISSPRSPHPSPRSASPRSSLSSPRSPLLSPSSSASSPRAFPIDSSTPSTHTHIHYHHHPYHISGSTTSPPTLRAIYNKMPPKSPSMPSFPSESLPHLNRSSSCASLRGPELETNTSSSHFIGSNFFSLNQSTTSSSSSSSVPSLASSSSFSSMDISLASPKEGSTTTPCTSLSLSSSPIPPLQTAALSLSSLSISSPHSTTSTSFSFNSVPFKFETTNIFKEGNSNQI